MSEESKSSEALQGILAHIEDLNSQLASAVGSANRRWKITAWVFGILCVVIFLYLGYIYLTFKPFLDAKFLVTYARNEVTNNLNQYQRDLTEQLKDQDQVDKIVAALDKRTEDLKAEIPKFREKLAAELVAKAPEHMAAIQPRLAELKEKMPDLTVKFSTALVDQAEPIADKLRDLTIGRMAELKDYLLGMTKEKLDERKDELQKIIDDSFKQVLDQHLDDMKKLDGDALTRVLQPGFEEAAGPVLDKFNAGLERAIKATKENLADLLDKRAQGTLTRKEELELRYVQLWKTYWSLRMKEGVGDEDVQPLTLE